MSESRMWPTPNAAEWRAEKYTLETSYRHYQEGRQTHLSQWVRDDRFMEAPVQTVSQPSMFSAADFPASPTHSPAAAADPPMTATSGPSTPVSFASYDPDGSWRKTCQGYSQVMLDGSLERFSETWPRAGTMRNGIAYLRQPLAPLTDATESGWLPTPKMSQGGGERSGDRAGTDDLVWMARTGMWPTPDSGVFNLNESVESVLVRREVQRQRHHNGNGFGLRLASAVKMPWATTTSNEHKVGRSSTNGRQLTREVYDAEGLSRDTSQPTNGGSLNPTWVEWLMGYPLGWTALKDWGTRLSRRSPNGSAAASLTRST